MTQKLEQDQTGNQDLDRDGLLNELILPRWRMTRLHMGLWDMEATLQMTENRRSINLQIDINEPGRIIGYQFKALQLLAQKLSFITAIQEPSATTIDYAGTPQKFQTHAQKL